MLYCEMFIVSHALGNCASSSVIVSCCDNYGLSEDPSRNPFSPAYRVIVSEF